MAVPALVLSTVTYPNFGSAKKFVFDAGRTNEKLCWHEEPCINFSVVDP
jgi:hypothetical protein